MNKSGPNRSTNFKYTERFQSMCPIKGCDGRLNRLSLIVESEPDPNESADKLPTKLGVCSECGIVAATHGFTKD